MKEAGQRVLPLLFWLAIQVSILVAFCAASAPGPLGHSFGATQVPIWGGVVFIAGLCIYSIGLILSGFIAPHSRFLWFFATGATAGVVRLLTPDARQGGSDLVIRLCTGALLALAWCLLTRSRWITARGANWEIDRLPVWGLPWFAIMMLL